MEKVADFPKKVREGLRLSEEARQAYVRKDWAEAASLAQQSLDKLPLFDQSGGRGEAEATLRFANRHLAHPNPGLFRRIWWTIDGEWAVALGTPHDFDGRPSERD